MVPSRPAVAEQLAGRWNDAEPTAQLQFDYPFLHQGLARALVCDIGDRAGAAAVYWKYGVWAFDKASGTRLLLEQHMHDSQSRTISVRLQGHRGVELVRWLRERLDHRNGQFGLAGLQPTVDDFPRHEPQDGRAAPRRPDTDRHNVGSVKDERQPTGATAPTFDKLPANLFVRESRGVLPGELTAALAFEDLVRHFAARFG